MKTPQILTATFIICTLCSCVEHETKNRTETEPCNMLTVEHQRTTFEKAQATLADSLEFDTTYVFIEDKKLANLEKLADWAVENAYLIRWHKDVEFGDTLSNVLYIGFYKSDLQSEDFTTFIEAIKSGQRYLKLDECIDGTTLKLRPIEK